MTIAEFSLPGGLFRRPLLATAILVLLSSSPCLRGESIELSSPGATVRILNREIVTFRVSIGVYGPGQRALAAENFIRKVAEESRELPELEVKVLDGMAHIMVKDQVLLSITPGDVFEIRGDTLQSTVEKVVKNLEVVFRESLEMRDHFSLLRSTVWAIGSTLAFLLLVWLMIRNRRWVERRLIRYSTRQADQLKSNTLRLVGLQNTVPILRGTMTSVFWLIVSIATYLWIHYILLLFPHTRSFGEQLGSKFFGLATSFWQNTLHALPNLGIVFMIWILARFATTANRRFFKSVARGTYQSRLFDASTAPVTQRLIFLLIWVVAVIVAFPYIPGSHSPAFRGISVLAGLMLSLGSTNLIAQMVNGLIVIYNRICRVGDYVRVNEHEGTLTYIGISTSRLRTYFNEEVYIPNSHLTSSALINYTQTENPDGVVAPVKVSIGYSTPWRQVHAMLLEAAQMTDGVRHDPEPTVLQLELADYYVIYQLNAVVEDAVTRRAIISRLNANVQDVFNSYGVQIMSPHYRNDPAEPVVVPRDKWIQPPAKG